MPEEIFNLSKTDGTTPTLFDLTKAVEKAGTAMPSKLRLGANWDPQTPKLDVDLSVGIVDTNGKLVARSEFAFYGNRDVAGVLLSEDNLDGVDATVPDPMNVAGDDEWAVIDLANIADSGVGFIASLSVYNDDDKRTLKDAGGCNIRLVNEDTGEEILRVSMATVDSDAMNVIKVTNVDGNMIVEAVEISVAGDINAVVASLQ